MLVRAALAGLDHNANSGRGQAETVDGRLRMDLVKNRVGNKWYNDSSTMAKNLKCLLLAGLSEKYW